MAALTSVSQSLRGVCVQIRLCVSILKPDTLRRAEGVKCRSESLPTVCLPHPSQGAVISNLRHSIFPTFVGFPSF